MARDLLRREEGAALVEAALVLPILLVLVLALADLSLYFWNLNLAGKAVELGLRRAIVSAPVASGPGLDRAESASYWDGLEPGTRCRAEQDDPCPRFSVKCGFTTGCLCSGPACRFTFAPERLAPILSAMRAVLPGLKAENVRLSYATDGRGFVGRPAPVPVAVGLSLVGYAYAPAFAGTLFPAEMPLLASATLPGEALGSR